jgi:hypothetical protein
MADILRDLARRIRMVHFIFRDDATMKPQPLSTLHDNTPTCTPAESALAGVPATKVATAKTEAAAIPRNPFIMRLLLFSFFNDASRKAPRDPAKTVSTFTGCSGAKTGGVYTNSLLLFRK